MTDVTELLEEKSKKAIMIHKSQEKIRLAEEHVFSLRDKFYAENIYKTYLSYGIDKNDLQKVLSWKGKKSWIAIGDNIFVVFSNGKVGVISKGKSYYIKHSKYGEWNDISKIAVSDSCNETIVYGVTHDGRVRVNHIYKRYRQSTFYYAVEEWTDIEKIKCTEDGVCGIKRDGTIVGSGDCDKYVLKDWRNIEDVYFKGYSGVIGLRKDGTLICDGIYNYVEAVCGWNEIVKIAVGDLHVLGLKADGTVVCLQSDNVNLDTRCCEVSLWSNIVDVWAGENISIGLREDGTILCCGKDAERYRTRICFNVSNFHDECNMYMNIKACVDKMSKLKKNKKHLLDQFEEYGGRSDFGKKRLLNKMQKQLSKEIEEIIKEMSKLEDEICKLDGEFEQIKVVHKTEST